MGFREGMCPKCHELLQVPSDRENIICMYCGQEIRTKDAFAALAEHQQLISGRVSDNELYEEVKADFVSMVEKLENPMKNFRKNTYEEMFKEYYRNHLYIIEAIDKAYCVTVDKDAFIRKAADDFVGRAGEIIDAILKKSKKEDQLIQFNMALVIYILPVFLEYHGGCSKILVDTIVDTWNNSFEKANISSCSFDVINGGFRRRWCYITTAVCETLGKGDDCYELNLLRAYRDGYLMQTQDGTEVVREYYDVAPTIVKRIGRKDDAADIYQGIYDRYLKNCVELIEADRLEECREVYSDMVNDLKQEYFITNKKLS